MLTFVSGGVHMGIANNIEVTTHYYIFLLQAINLLVEVSKKVELSGVWTVYIDQGAVGLCNGANGY